jgi:hypothetical protein
MTSQDTIRAILLIIFYVALQVLFIRNLVFWDVAFCFIYLIPILWLPGDMDSIWVILISFGIGLFVDMFYNTPGVHASASTLVGFLRKPLLRYFFPSRGVENEIHVSLSRLGHQRYFVYITIIIFIHHLVLFFVEAAGFHLFLHTLLKIFSSLIFTVMVIYLWSLFTTNISKEKQ